MLHVLNRFFIAKVCNIRNNVFADRLILQEALGRCSIFSLCLLKKEIVACKGKRKPQV